jgi:hypothetical protein
MSGKSSCFILHVAYAYPSQLSSTLHVVNADRSDDSDGLFGCEWRRTMTATVDDNEDDE